MSKQYQVKQVETNSRGYKVTRTLSTEDEEEIKALIGLGSKGSSDTKKTASAKKEAANKTTKKSKKGVVIDAEFKEIKKGKTKESKSTAKKTVAKPKALPAPKKQATESKPKKEEKKKPTATPKQTTESKKSGVCIFKDKTGRFTAYQETMGFSLYDKNSCVQQLMFETDAAKALKEFGNKIKEILAEEKKKSSP